MRVIAGSARGTILVAPQGRNVRPTTDRVKEAMFSIIQFRLPGARVLDLFAGSGALGIEALSRGAKSAVFVDESRASAELVKKNLQKTRLLDRSNIEVNDFRSFLTRAGSGQFDLVLLDPPYHEGLWEQAMDALSSCQTLSEYGIILCERDGAYPPVDVVGRLVLKKRYHYGKTVVDLYTVKGTEDENCGLPGQL